MFDQRRSERRFLDGSFSRFTGQARGMTLVELLIMIALFMIMIMLVVLALRPNDDLKCRMEAERLAAYINRASAEAKMRAGTTRVNFSFIEQGRAQIQVTELKVDSTQVSWADYGDTPHSVKKPVRLSEVETHLQGVIKEGDEGFLLFKNSFTPGGVARLMLETVEYAVIVPSNGEAAYVERGHGSLPKIREGRAARSRGRGGLNTPELGKTASSSTERAASAAIGQSASSGSSMTGQPPPPFKTSSFGQRPDPSSLVKFSR